MARWHLRPRYFLPESAVMRAPATFARRRVPPLLLACALVGVTWAQQPSKPQSPSGAKLERATVSRFVTQNCTTCHNSEVKKAGLDLDALRAEDVEAHSQAWEK